MFSVSLFFKLSKDGGKQNKRYAINVARNARKRLLSDNQKEIRYTELTFKKLFSIYPALSLRK